MKNKIEIGLDLIKKSYEIKVGVIKELTDFDIEKAKEAAKNVGLDLTKGKQNDVIYIYGYKLWGMY